jgi:hypothetical protein
MSARLSSLACACRPPPPPPYLSVSASLCFRCPLFMLFVRLARQALPIPSHGPVELSDGGGEDRRFSPPCWRVLGPRALRPLPQCCRLPLPPGRPWPPLRTGRHSCVAARPSSPPSATSADGFPALQGPPSPPRALFAEPRRARCTSRSVGQGSWLNARSGVRRHTSCAREAVESNRHPVGCPLPRRCMQTWPSTVASTSS